MSKFDIFHDFLDSNASILKNVHLKFQGQAKSVEKSVQIISNQFVKSAFLFS